MRSWIGGIAVLLSLPGTGVWPVGAAEPAATGSLAGDYVCRADCHRSDAPPSIAVDGMLADCRSDLGGVFHGRVLSSRSIACFNQVGTLSDDGTTIRWSNGGVWEKRR